MKSAEEKNAAAWEVLLPGEGDVLARHEEDNEQGAVHMTAAGKKEDTRPGEGSQASQLAQHVADMSHRREDMKPVLVLVAQADELRILPEQQEEHRKMAEGTAAVDMLEGQSRVSSGEEADDGEKSSETEGSAADMLARRVVGMAARHALWMDEAAKVVAEEVHIL